MKTMNITFQLIEGQTGDKLHPKNVPRGTESLQDDSLTLINNW